MQETYTIGDRTFVLDQAKAEAALAGKRVVGGRETMTFNLAQLKGWAERSGLKFWTTPQAKNTVEGYGGRHRCIRCNTCEVCPTGARYSPDWTFKQLLAQNKIQLHDHTLVRKLVLDDKTTRVVAAQAATEHRFRVAVEAARCGIWEWDLDRDRVYMSEVTGHVFGWGGAGVVSGSEVLERIAPDHPVFRLRSHP